MKHKCMYKSSFLLYIKTRHHFTKHKNFATLHYFVAKMQPGFNSCKRDICVHSHCCLLLIVSGRLSSLLHSPRCLTVSQKAPWQHGNALPPISPFKTSNHSYPYFRHRAHKDCSSKVGSGTELYYNLITNCQQAL